MERAYFIYRPRRLQDLRVPHLPEQENAFEIIAVRQLSKLDYENFSEDLLADRAFLDGYGQAHTSVKQCILVTRRNAEDGILVEPDGRGFVLRAAYYAQETGTGVAES